MGRDVSRSGAPYPGQAMVGLGPMAAVALIAFNDRWLRAHYPGFWSGKLSDIGICFLLPVLLVAFWEWATWCMQRVRSALWQPAGIRVHIAAFVLSTVYYSSMELWPAFGKLHQRWLNWVFPFWHFRPGTADPTDLFALIMLPVAWVYLRRRRTRN
jgi:hypothetical protein